MIHACADDAVTWLQRGADRARQRERDRRHVGAERDPRRVGVEQAPHGCPRPLHQHVGLERGSEVAAAAAVGAVGEPVGHGGDRGIDHLRTGRPVETGPAIARAGEAVTEGTHGGRHCHTDEFSAALGGLGQALRRAAGGLDVALVEVAELGTVDEQHSVALPVEPVREDDLAFGAGWHALQFDSAHDPVADAQVELVGVRRGECMRLPDRHGAILPDTTSRWAIREEFGRPR